MKRKIHHNYWSLLVGLILLALGLPALSDGPYEDECNSCQEWDYSAHECVDIPNAPCWILHTWGEDATYDTCFQGNQAITCIPQCGTIIETVSYLCHKLECPGYFIYTHDYSDITYTWSEKECTISYNTGIIAQDMIECGAVGVDCAATLAQLPGMGAGVPPDSSLVASCLDGLANCVSRDSCDYFLGCDAGVPVLSGPQYRCTLSRSGCGDF